MNDKCVICGGDSGGYQECKSCEDWKANEDSKRGDQR